jgi:uncharacterized protein YbjT (DUF2867 family)
MDPPIRNQRTPVAVMGATGYVGGRLVPELLKQGYVVRCLSREPRKLADRPWRGDGHVDIRQMDLEQPDAVVQALGGCQSAYYLVHGLPSGNGAELDRFTKLAQNFARAAATAGVRRIITVSSLGASSDSRCQFARQQYAVETALASTSIPLTSLRVGLIIGSGSASFEILRYLVERLPAMITPRWVESDCQPIAVRDLLHWLVACLRVPETAGQTLEIGGPDVISYRQLMRCMSEELQLPRRWMIGVPVVTPRLSAAWISLITPVTYRVARPLAEMLRGRVVVQDTLASRLMPHDPLPVRMAVRQAIAITRSGEIPTRWSAAGPIPGDPSWSGGQVFSDQRTVDIDADAIAVYAAVCRIGGGHGWYAGDVLWRLRGWLDQLVGGPGLRRGRRHPENVEFGEALDFWRVVGLERGRFLRLHAEMKVPGIAQLEFQMCPRDESTQTRLTMTARFRPRGLLGILYWYAVLPLHAFVFRGMLEGIKRAAETPADDQETGRKARPVTSHARVR